MTLFQVRNDAMQDAPGNYDYWYVYKHSSHAYTYLLALIYHSTINDS